MTTAFQRIGFADDAFQMDDLVVSVPGISGGGRYRYFTPERPPLKGKLKRKIDRAVEQETKLKETLLKYETTGIDSDVLNDIALRIREIQLTILRLALESELASQYIEWKRKEEDEDIDFIMSIL